MSYMSVLRLMNPSDSILGGDDFSIWNFSITTPFKVDFRPERQVNPKQPFCKNKKVLDLSSSL